MNKPERPQQKRAIDGCFLQASGLLLLLGLLVWASLAGNSLAVPPVTAWVIPVIGGLWLLIGMRVKRSNSMILVTSGLLLLQGGLVAVYSYTMLNGQGPGAGFELIFLYLLVVFPLFVIAGVWLLIGLIGRAKKMPRRSSIMTSLVGVGLLVGLPLIGGSLVQSPLFLGPYPLSTYNQSVSRLAWSPDGRRIAGGGDYWHTTSSDTTVQVWDVAAGSKVYTYRGHSALVTALAWSPDGKRIASGGADYTVQVWDAMTGDQVYTYRGHSSGVSAVAWSPDGKRIASADARGTVQVWDVATGGKVYSGVQKS